MPPILTVKDVSETALGRLSAGERGINETITAMFALIDSAQRVGAVQDVARATVDLQGIYDFAEKRVRFEADPPELERLQTPQSLLRSIRETGTVAADCDDLAMLVASLIQAQGRRPVLICVGLPSKSTPARFGHVFAGAMIDPAGPLTRENVTPLDPQEGFGVGVWPKPCRGRRVDKCVARTRIYAWNGGDIRW